MEIVLEQVVVDGTFGLCGKCNHIYPVMTIERIKPSDKIAITNNPSNYRLVRHPKSLTNMLCSGSETKPKELFFKPNIVS